MSEEYAHPSGGIRDELFRINFDAYIERWLEYINKGSAPFQCGMVDPPGLRLGSVDDLQPEGADTLLLRRFEGRDGSGREFPRDFLSMDAHAWWEELCAWPRGWERPRC